MTFSKRYKRLKPRPKTVHGVDSRDLQAAEASIRNNDHDDNKSNKSKKSENHHGMSVSQPSILVAVDTSGAAFQRQSSFRQSLRSSGSFPKGTASLDRKSRRRRTVKYHLIFF